jgi:hypothetical protein
LPLGPLFLPLLHGLARRLAAGGGDEVTLGDEVSLEAAVPPDGSRAFRVGPSGVPREVPVSRTGAAARASFTADESGFHEIRIEAPGGTVLVSRLVAVNFPAEESRLGRAPPAAVEALRSALGAEVVRDPGDIVGSLREETARRELWPALVAAALVLALVEMVLARTFSPR